MPKSKQTKLKEVIKPTRTREIVRVLMLLVLLVIIAQQNIRINNLEMQAQTLSNGYMAQALLQPIYDLNDPLPTEPSTGKVFLSAQHLTLPQVPNSFGQLVYSTAYKDNDSQFPVHIAAKSDIAQAARPMNSTQKDPEDIFKALPTVQACARGIGITYTKTDDPIAAQKTLANGKTLYFYTESTCKNEALLDYVKQIDSY